MGALRWELTGHTEATDRDYEWCAAMTDGEIQCTDPQDAVDFNAGMRAAERVSAEVGS